MLFTYNLRITEKNFKSLLQDCLNENLINKEPHVDKVTNFIDNEVFIRSEHSTGTWKFPYAIWENNIVSHISISSKDTSKYHKNHVGLVDVALYNEEKKIIWKSIISKYVQINKIMNKKKDLTDEEIDEFDKLVDEWFEEIIDNFGI